MKASELINNLQKLIVEHGDLPVIGIGFDSDTGSYTIDEFDFEKKELVKEDKEYRFEYPYKNEPTTPVFYMYI